MKLYTNDGHLVADTDTVSDTDAIMLEAVNHLKDLSKAHKCPVIIFFQLHGDKVSHAWSIEHPTYSQREVVGRFVKQLLSYLGELLPSYVVTLVKRDEIGEIMGGDDEGGPKP